jgi:hypothetical protein
MDIQGWINYWQIELEHLCETQEASAQHEEIDLQRI